LSKQTSVANMNLVIGSLASYLTDPATAVVIGTKQYKLEDRSSMKTHHVHGKCESLVDYRQSCPHCHSQVTAPVIGSKAPSPKKTSNCTNDACKKDIAGQAVTKDFCSQEGCMCFLELTDVEARLSQGGKDPKMVKLSTEERASLEALRLSRPTQKAKKGGERFMVVVGRQMATTELPHSRIMNVRVLSGDNATDIAFLAELSGGLAETKSRLVVHYALQHESELTGQYEHVALIMPGPEVGSLLLVNLYAASDIRKVEVVTPDLENFELRDAIHHTIGALPAIRDDNDDRYTDTPFHRGLNELYAAKVEGGDYKLPSFVDFDGSAKAALARLYTTVANMASELKLAKKVMSK
jgi:hypothetical protein